MKIFSWLDQKAGASEGTFLFILATLFSKAIGAVYKVPLYSLLGPNGVGLYQMVFPVYALLLTLSSGAIPLAMTKLISSGFDGKKVLNKCAKIFVPIGLLLTFLIFVCSSKVALYQGNQRGETLYKAIAPSVVLVCLSACLKGYFQGNCNFKPTAITHVVGQVVKAVSALIALLIVKGDYQIKAFIACASISFSELITLLVLGLIYKRQVKIQRLEIKTNESKNLTAKHLFSFVIPLTLSSILFPVACFLDSFIAINNLALTYGENATAVYGVYTGGADCVIGLPLTLINCLAVGFLPKISGQKSAKNSFLTILVLSLLGAFAVIIFAPLASEILFKTSAFKGLLVSLLRFSSITLVFHSCLHAVNNILLSMEKQKVTFYTSLIGVIIRIILSLTLIKIAQINVFGMIISEVGCYFVALNLNLLYIYSIRKNKRMEKADENHVDRLGRRSKFFLKKGA